MRTRYGAAILTPVLAISLATPAQAQPRPDIAADWLDQTAATVAVTGPFEGDRAWTIAWLSASRAIQRPGRPAFEDAAVATAVHDVLVTLVPERKDALDAALATSLAAIPDGPAEQAGIRAGQREATRTLTEREGDGLDPASINKPFTPPPPAPGVYRLPPDAAATVGAGLGEAQPFLLDRAGRFRPGPPPAVGTPTYRRDLAEVRRYGSATSTDRTQEQTDTGLLWAQSPLGAYTNALRPLVTDHDRPLAWKVNLLATFTAATIDASIAVSEAKFAYLWWRPITAIREADGDPITHPDPTWTPLLTTPPGPEYPSAHSAYAGAAEQVLEHFTGQRTPVSFTISATVDGRVITRDYPRGTRWSVLTQENVDARVWVGAHYRTSDTTGATLGRRVADYDLRGLNA
jgi:hypothetical protein